MRHQLIAKLLGRLIVFAGLSMLLPLLISVGYGEVGSVRSFALSLGITVAVGGALMWIGRGGEATVFRREALVVVTSSWVLIGVLGGLPYLFDGVFRSPVDAYFETISGFTTTGATVLDEIAGSLSHGMHFWRCFTHWLGGMGIVVLFVAVFPQLGVGGKALFKQEVPGPITEGLRPKIRETSIALYRIYLLLTLACVVALRLAGMSWFDAACHAASTLGTGGFSTNNASIAGYDSAAIEMVIALFMLLAGVNFGLYFLALRGGGGRALRDRELWAYLGLVAAMTALIALIIAPEKDGIVDALRASVFQVLAVITTTGFITDDYDVYPNVAKALIFGLFFVGGMAGSTAGGIKTIRVIILARGCVREVARTFRPQLVTAVKVGRRNIDGETVSAVFVFFAVYVAIFLVGTLLMAPVTDDLVTASTAVAVTLGNVGPGLGDVGATESFSFLPGAAKLLLSGLMIIGRLEVFTVLVLLVPSFWKR